MKTIILILGCFASLFCSLPGATVDDFDLKTTEMIGRMIYEQDVIAAEATDTLFDQELDINQYPVRGWIVEKDGRNNIVTFVGEYEGDFYALFKVNKKGKRKPSFTKLERQRLSAYQEAAFQARNLARENIKVPCSDRYNFVVLDNPEEEGFLVYGLAATTDPDAVLVGGHYRFTISKDGKNIERVERLSSSCLTLDKTPSDMPPGATLAALTMSHIVSERPLEIHIFLNLLHKMDLYVATSDQHVWKIHNGKMDIIK